MSQTEFEKKLFDYIEKEQMIKPADRIVAAVSGGADSTALLYALWSLKQQSLISADLICVHINHRLRGSDSDRDEKFVIDLAGKLNVHVITIKVDVKGHAKNAKISIETAARELRINALIEIAKEKGCNTIATGHQADDNAETVIHRLLRGTGFRGLCGIRPKNFFEGGIAFIRPLLSFTRRQITDYLNIKNISWQTDKTNFDCSYKRNFIRHRLLPEIQVHSSKPVSRTLLNLSQAARYFQNKVIRQAEMFYSDIALSQSDSISLNLNKFSPLHPAVKNQLILMTLENLNVPQRNLTSGHFEKILELAQNPESNKKIDLPCYFTVRKEYGSLTFKRKPPRQIHTWQSFEEIKIDIPAKIQKGNLIIETSLLDGKQLKIEKFIKEKNGYIEWFDFDKIVPPIIIRKRKSGDKFHPLGMPAEKRIGKFLTDRKIPSNIRSNILLVIDREKIIWLWPVRTSEKAKVTGQTTKILQMQLTNKLRAF